jgi:glycosyltransferase involved in cell wall biosynthesis
MAHLPVAATNVGGMPEIIEDEKTGLLIKDRKPESFAEAIQKLFNDKSAADQMAKSLNMKINTEFSFQKMLAAVIAFYNK